MRPGTLKPSWSLVVFTVLTQAAVGLHLMRAWFRHAIFECGPPTEVGTIIDPIRPAALVILALGFAAAMLHLGRVGAARFTLSNLKSSWLSREVVLVLLFGAALALFYRVERLSIGGPAWREFLWWVVAALGLVVVMAISRIYMIRTVPAWNSFATPAAFFGTTFLLGAAVLTAMLVLVGEEGYFDLVLRRLRGFVAVMTAWQLLVTGVHLHRLGRQPGVARESARLMLTTYRGVLAIRLTSLIVGAWILILSTLGDQGSEHAVTITIAAALLLASELIGRYLFYAQHRRVGL